MHSSHSHSAGKCAHGRVFSDFAQYDCSGLLSTIIPSYVILHRLLHLYMSFLLFPNILQSLLYGIKGLLLNLAVLELCVCMATVVFSCKANASGTKMVRLPEGKLATTVSQQTDLLVMCNLIVCFYYYNCSKFLDLIFFKHLLYSKARMFNS